MCDIIDMKIKQDKSVFLEKFGDSPRLRVLDYLIGNQLFDFPITEIARGSNVSYNSLKIFFSQMIKDKFIIKTRRVGKSDFYKLNTKNLFIKELIKLDWILTTEAIIPQIEIKNHSTSSKG